MKPVIQEEKTGCGIASVAALAGVPYDAVRNVAADLGIFADDVALWSDTEYVRRLLGHYGLRVDGRETAFVSWDELPSPCLLAIKWRVRGTKEYWHWVVFTRRADGPVVLDPKKSLKKNERRDFGRMKPRWYISVCTCATKG